MKIKFARVLPEAKIPVKRKEDAAFDLWSAEGDVILPPHKVVKVDTGIATSFNENWVAIIKERGGNGSKGIAVRSGVVDSGFRDSWKICLMNLTDEEIVMPKEKAIAQVLILPVPEVEMEEVDYSDVLNVPSERGKNGFGSTDH